MYIPQMQLAHLKKKVVPRKVVAILGPRQTGKTTLLEHFLEDQTDYLFVTGEDIFIQEILSSQSLVKLKDFVGGKTLLVIDEAQKIPQIGLNFRSPDIVGENSKKTI